MRARKRAYIDGDAHQAKKQRVLCPLCDRLYCQRTLAVHMAACAKGRAHRGCVPDREQYIYIMSCPCVPGYVKIGRSCNLEQRRRRLSRGYPTPVVLERSWPNAGDLERFAHRALARVRAPGGPRNEWFQVTVEQASDIIEALLEQRASTAQPAPSGDP